MSAQLKILLPLTFEAFNALDVAVTGELADLNITLQRLPASAEIARNNVIRYRDRLNLARQILESARPNGYREAIKEQYKRDFLADA